MGGRKEKNPKLRMIHRIILLHQAELDIEGAYDWYENQSSGLGQEFLRNVEACLALIKRNPEIYSVVYRNFRRGLVRRFPFAIFYEREANDLVIYAVFHCSQDPVKWKKRLRIA